MRSFLVRRDDLRLPGATWIVAETSDPISLGTPEACDELVSVDVAETDPALKGAVEAWRSGDDRLQAAWEAAWAWEAAVEDAARRGSV